jgi:uncharacterized membrane protein
VLVTIAVVSAVLTNIITVIAVDDVTNVSHYTCTAAAAQLKSFASLGVCCN